MHLLKVYALFSCKGFLKLYIYTGKIKSVKLNSNIRDKLM